MILPDVTLTALTKMYFNKVWVFSALVMGMCPLASLECATEIA